VAARSKAGVCGPSLAGIAGSNPTGVMDVCRLWALRVVRIEVSASGRSLVQRSSTDCGVSEYDREPSTVEEALAHWGAVEP
jgi:hypothetical protein